MFVAKKGKSDRQDEDKPSKQFNLGVRKRERGKR